MSLSFELGDHSLESEHDVEHASEYRTYARSAELRDFAAVVPP